MRLSRWAARLLSSLPPATVRLATVALGVFMRLSPRALIFAAGLCLVGVGFWPLSPSLALVLLGLLLIRDAERPDTSAKP